MGSFIATVRGLSPLGPIFGKELRVTARRKRTYWLRFLYLAVLLVVLLVPYTATYYDMNYGGVARKSQKLAELGIWFFASFSYFTLGSMMLISPILTCTAINSERLHKTLPVLLMTPITAWQIVAGKLFSRMLIAFTLIGLSLPVLALVRLLGGVELHQMAASVCISASAALFAACVGLLLSTLMNRAYAVILMTYGVLGILYGLIPLLTVMTFLVLFKMRGMAGERIFFGLLSYTNPFFQMFLACIPERPPFRVVPWHAVVGLHLGASVLLVLLSALVLRRMARKENEGSGGAPAPPAGAAGGVVSPIDGTAPDAAREFVPSRPGKLLPSRTVSDNPVLWREVRRPLLAKVWQRAGITVIFLGSLLFIYGALASDNDLDDPDAQIGFGIVFCGLMNLLACVLAGTAIGQEKESDTWTLLLATPISGGRIVMGKIVGLLRRMVWPGALIVAHFFLFTLAGVIEWTAFLIVIWLTFVTNFTWVVTGLYYSLKLRTVTAAVIANLLSPVILYGLTSALLAIAGAVIDRRPEWGEAPMLYAPYVYIATSVEQMNPRRAEYQYRDASHRYWAPVFNRVSREEFVALVALCGLAHLTVSGLLLWYTVSRFDQIVGRAPQIGGTFGRAGSTGLLRPA